MTIEAEKQGKTLMVFTIVTIIFVSFLIIASKLPFLPKENGKVAIKYRTILILNESSHYPSLPPSSQFPPKNSTTL
jgi:hypothetical protein